MPVNIGPKIGIEGEAEYRKQIQNIIQQTKTLKSEYQAVATASDKETSAMKRNADKRKLMSQQIKTQKDRLAELENMLKKSEEKYGENAKETQKWRQAVADATTELHKMEAELQKIPNGLQTMGDSMQTAGKKISDAGAFLMPLSTAAAAIGIAAVKTTADFDSSMSKVAAISGATGEEFDALRDKAREMGAQTKFSAKEAADAFTYMAMAGWKSEDMMEGIEGIMNLAAADGLDLATTSDIVTDALTAMGLTAADSSHFADVLAAASTNANTNVALMGETFKYAAPLAGALGFTIEDLAVATGLMANSGIKGSQAGTALRGWLTRLSKPTKESSAAMEALGISMTDSNGNMKTLMQIIEETRDAFSGLTEDEKAMYAAMLAGQNGMSGMLAIINATEGDLKKLAKATKNADGTAKKMAETMQNNLNGQVTILKSSLQEAGISIGDALIPKIREGIKAVQDFTNWFNNLSDAEKQQVINAGLVVAAAGPVLMVLGKTLTAVGQVVSAVGAFQAAITNAGSVAAFMTTTTAGLAASVGLAVAPLAAMAVAFTNINQNIDGVTPELAQLREDMADTEKAVSQTRSELDGLAESMKTNSTNINNSGASLDYWRDQLMNCYDAEGNLKEGMESTAEYALTQLNAAMGSDYSTEFIAQAKDSAAALGEISGAVDTCIEKMKEQAIQQAFADEYASALKAQADASVNLVNAENEAKRAMDGLAQAQKDVNEALKRDPRTDPGAVAAQTEAVRRMNNYRDAVQETSDRFVEASGAAAEADAVVAGLDTTMQLLAGEATDSVDKAAQAYANTGTQATEAGAKAQQAAKDSLAEWQKLSEEKIKPPELDQQAAEANAQATTKTMQGVFDSNTLTGKVGSVEGAEKAAQDARSTMQSFFDRHPILAKVVQTVTGGAIGGRANGGFVKEKQLSWLAEDGAEVVIPLSASKRSRAMELYQETGAILGVGSIDIPASSMTSTTNTYNSGGNVINVYGAPGQDVHELAHEIADIINTDVTNRGAVWA